MLSGDMSKLQVVTEKLHLPICACIRNVSRGSGIEFCYLQLCLCEENRGRKGECRYVFMHIMSPIYGTISVYFDTYFRDMIYCQS